MDTGCLDHAGQMRLRGRGRTVNYHVCQKSTPSDRGDEGEIGGAEADVVSYVRFRFKGDVLERRRGWAPTDLSSDISGSRYYKSSLGYGPLEMGQGYPMSSAQVSEGDLERHA